MSLRQQGIKATKWTALSMVFTSVIQFAKLIVLSRMLTPVDYGLMGMIMIVVGVAEAFGDMGVTNIIFHKKDLTKEQLSSIYLLNIISGVVVFLIVAASSPLVEMLFRESQLTGPLYLVSTLFLCSSVGQLYQAMFQKEIRFRSLAYMDVVASTLGFVVAVVLAYLGYGVYALVWSQIVNMAMKSFLCFALGYRIWKVKLTFRPQKMMEYLRFGAYQMGEKTIHFLSSNFDYILIGRFFGAEMLGLYNFAYNLVIIPVLKINPVISQVALPLMGKIQEKRDQLKAAYYQLLRILSMLNAPIYVGLIVTAPYLIPFVFGDKWESAIVYVQILAVMGFFRSMISPISSLLVAIGRVDLGFKWTLALMLVMIPSIALGAYLGEAVGIAIAFACLQAAFYFLKYIWIMRQLFRSSFMEYIKIAVPAVSISVLMGGIVALVPMLDSYLAPIAILLLQISIGAAIYAVFNWRYNRYAVNYILEAVVFRKQRSEINVSG